MPITGLLRRPGAWVPLVLSLAALTLIVAHVALVGVARQADEGAAARIFQLLMLLDAVAIAVFAARWLPVAPKAAMSVVALQVVVAAIPLVTLAVLEW
jgi:hypothetical protein